MAPPHRAALETRISDLSEGKEEESKEQMRWRIAAWKPVAPPRTDRKTFHEHKLLENILRYHSR
jgi:hypothetical protein